MQTSGKKILVVAPTPFFSDRGCHIRIAGQSRALSERGHRVRILTYHRGKDPAGLDVVRTPRLPWRVPVGFGPSWHKLYLDVFLFGRLLYELVVFRPDVLHCHLHEGAIAGVLLRPFYRGSIIFDSQGSLVDELSEVHFFRTHRLFFAPFRFLEAAIYRFSRHIVVSNEANRRELVHGFNVPPEKVSIVPDGALEERTVAPTPERRMCRESYGVPDGALCIVYGGALTPVAGVEALIEIARELSRLRKDVHWIVAGSPNIEALRARVHGEGLADIVSVCPLPFEDLPCLLRAGDIAISLKQPTTQGNLKLVYYALAKLPIVCYDQESNRAIIGDGASYLSQAAPVSLQAKALSTVLDTPKEKLRAIADLARSHIEAHYSSDAIVATLEDAYARGR